MTPIIEWLITWPIVIVAFGALLVFRKPRKRYERPEDFVVLATRATKVDMIDRYASDMTAWLCGPRGSDDYKTHYPGIRQTFQRCIEDLERRPQDTAINNPFLRPYSDEDGIVMSAEPDKNHRLVLTDYGWVSEELRR